MKAIKVKNRIEHPLHCCISKCDVPQNRRNLSKPTAKCRKCSVFKAFGK